MSGRVNQNILSKGWNYFDIMHLDRRVARIFENGSCKIYYKSFMPYNLYFAESDDLDEKINNLSNFYYWCASRVLTLDRKYAKEILNSIGAYQSQTDKDRAAISISYHGVSLMDVYWIKGAKEQRRFEEISLFRHSLSDAFVDVTLRGKELTLQNAELITSKDQAGDIGTPGVAPKAWIRKGKTFYLLKDGAKRDVEAELLASRIADCFRVDHVSYTEDEFSGTTVTKCKIITSEEKSLVTSEFIEIYCINKDKDKMEFILSKDKYSYYMMNIIDYLVGNTDRHWGNWGFYVDNKTNKIEKLYPLMDFNKAFTAYDTIEGSICQTTKERMSQKDAAVEAVKKIGLNQIKDVNKDWFKTKKMQKMFFSRLEVLKNV